MSLNSISKQEEDRSIFYANILLLLNNNIKHLNFESKDFAEVLGREPASLEDSLKEMLKN